MDVRQKFQFGGIGALFGHEIDMLVTPDPLYKPGLRFTPVFDYEQVLVVGPDHRLRDAEFVNPTARRRNPDYLSGRDRPAGYLHPVSDAGWDQPQAAQADRDNRHHAADGGAWPRRGRSAALAGRGKCREVSMSNQSAWGVTGLPSRFSSACVRPMRTSTICVHSSTWPPLIVLQWHHLQAGGWTRSHAAPWRMRRCGAWPSETIGATIPMAAFEK